MIMPTVRGGKRSSGGICPSVKRVKQEKVSAKDGPLEEACISAPHELMDNKHPQRRSSRRRNCKSARELLGLKTPIKVDESDVIRKEISSGPPKGGRLKLDFSRSKIISVKSEPTATQETTTFLPQPHETAAAASVGADVKAIPNEVQSVAHMKVPPDDASHEEDSSTRDEGSLENKDPGSESSVKESPEEYQDDCMNNFVVIHSGEGGKGDAPIILRISTNGDFEGHLNQHALEQALAVINKEGLHGTTDQVRELQQYTVVSEDPSDSPTQVLADSQADVECIVAEGNAAAAQVEHPDHLTPSSKRTSSLLLSDSAEDFEIYRPYTEQDIEETCRTKTGRKKPSEHLVATRDLKALLDQIDSNVDLTEHVKFLKSNLRGKMQCKHCQDEILNRHHFRAHMRQAHPDLDFKPFKCPLCDYKAAIKATIAHHINTHSEVKPYVCSQCGKGFAFLQKLQLHMKYHNDQRDQICPICKMAFHEYRTLRNHVQKVHGVPKPTDFIRALRTSKSADETSAEPTSTSTLITEKDLPSDVIVISEDGSTKDLEKVIPVNAGSVEMDSYVVSSNEDGSKGIDHNGAEGTGEVVVKADTGQGLQNEGTPKEDLEDSAQEAQVEMSAEGNEDWTVVVMSPNKRSKIKGPSKVRLQTKLFNESVEAAKAASPSMVEKPADTEPQDQAELSSLVSGKRKKHVTPSSHLKYCRFSSKQCGSQTAVWFNCTLCSPNDDSQMTSDPQEITESEQSSEGKEKREAGTSTFKSQSQFVGHIEKAHPDIKGWECKFCNFRSRLRPSLITHMKIHTGEKVHQCHICQKRFLHKHKLTNHLRHHENLRRVKCPHCLKAFNETNDLTKHIRRVHVEGKQHPCSLCGKVFKDLANLKHHMETHKPNREAKCEVCHKVYKGMQSLKQHMKGHSCMYHCEICDRSFGSYSGFMAHKVMHDESYEGFKCQWCDSTLHTKGSLNRHMKIVHSDERKFVCNVCNYAFKSKKDLQSHNICHIKEKHYECSICHFLCKRMDSLKVHMLRHAKTKPFRCEFCGKEYTQKQALLSHLAKHSKMKDQCLYCSEEIPDRAIMQAHMKACHMDDMKRDTAQIDVHIASKDEEVEEVTVFLCEECSSVFLTREALTDHLLSAHMVESLPQGSDNEAPDALMEVMATEEVTSESTQHGKPNTTESQIRITNPGSSNEHKIVTLVHPVTEVPQSVSAPSSHEILTKVLTENEQQQEVPEVKSDKEQSEEAVVTFTDPSTNLQYMVTVPAASLDSFLGGVEYEEEAVMQVEQEVVASESLQPLEIVPPDVEPLIAQSSLGNSVVDLKPEPTE